MGHTFQFSKDHGLKILGFSESLQKYLSKWYHQSSYLRDKSIRQFSRTMDYSPWSEAEKWQIRARTKYWIETHHFKGICLSFQKILKFLTLDQRYSSYGCWKMFNYTPHPPFNPYLSAAITGSKVINFNVSSERPVLSFQKIRKSTWLDQRN